jgi:hypothetical protein
VPNVSWETGTFDSFFDRENEMPAFDKFVAALAEND